MHSQKIYSGKNSINVLSSILKHIKPNHIFLVTGKKSFKTSQAEHLLESILKDHKFIRFFDFEANPKINDIEKGIALFHKASADFVLGIGGGSVLDIAKAISILDQENKIEELIKSPSREIKRKVPSVLIPTTAGTGSESTQFSVIYIDKQKYSLDHQTMLPNYAILEPRLTYNLSAHLTACCGMDALSQGIESFWSVRSTEESRSLSESAITIILDNINNAVKAPTEKFREQMLKGSNLAGQAINIARTTAAHAASYPLTSYFNIPHGHAVALTLPSFIKFNADISEKTLQDKRGLDYVKNCMRNLFNILGVSNGEQAEEKITKMMVEIGLDIKLSKFLKSKEDLEIIIENGFDPQRVINNPRIVEKNDLIKIVNGVF